MNIAIVGGGISGLAAARGLLNAGHAVSVHERAGEVRAVGAGIGLWPTALRCLRRLGLSDAVRESAEVRGFEFRSAKGRCLARADMEGWVRGMGEPLRFVDRGTLLCGLAAALPAGVLCLGQQARAVRSEGSGVVIDFDGGASCCADLVVIAGGTGVRGMENVGGARGYRYSGATCWRGICMATEKVREGHCTIQFGRGQRFGMNPLPGGRVYWWATQRTGCGGGSEDEKGELLRLFGAFGGAAPGLIESTPAWAMRRDDLYDANETGWGDGCVVAIGDAAHPILPTLGMAGTMAIEDAWVLVDEVKGGPGVAHRLHHRRSARVNRLRRLSRIASRVGHARGGLAVARDLGMTALPDRCVFRSVLELQQKEVRL